MIYTYILIKLYIYMTDENIEYGKVVKNLGSSRFRVETVNGDEIETGLKGELKNKSKNNKLYINDWVRIQNLGFEVSGTMYKIVERIGADKDKSVKILKKSGLLTMKIKESKIKDDMNNIFTDNIRVNTKVADIDDDFINDF